MTAALGGSAPPAAIDPVPDRPAAAPLTDSASPAADAPWARVVQSAGTPRLRALLEQVTLASLDEQRAVLAPAPEVRRLLEQRLAEVEQHVAKALGRPVQCVLQGDERSEPAPTEPGPPPAESSVNVVMSHPLVQRAIEVFNARVVRVEPAERTVRSDGE